MITPNQPARFGETTSLIELPISWALDDFPHFEYLWTATHLMDYPESESATIAHYWSLNDAD